MKYFTLFLLITFNLLQAIGQQSIIEERDSIAMVYLVKAETALEKGKIKKAKKLFRKAFEASSSNVFVQQKAVEFYIKQNDFKSASNCISLSGMKNSQYTEKAQNLFYRGVVNLHEGWGGVHAAYSNFIAANEQMKRNPYPDLNLWSDILVACGYTSIVARGVSSDGSKDKFCIIHPIDLVHAIPYFQFSLLYNPENEVAQKNLDSITTRIINAGYELPLNEGFLPPLDSLPDIVLDSLRNATLNITDSIRNLNVNRLPKQIDNLITHLDQYDEVVMVLDISGSMDFQVNWDEALSRFNVLKEISMAIAKKLNTNTSLGAVTVGGSCDDPPEIFSGIGSLNRFDLGNKVDALITYGATPLNNVIQKCPQLFTSSGGNKTIILISDGMDSCGESFDLCSSASMLNSYNIELSVFSFLLEGESFESDYAYQVYECMTEVSEGKIFSMDEEGYMEERLIDKLQKNIDLTLPCLKPSNRLKLSTVIYEFEINPLMKKIEVSL